MGFDFRIFLYSVPLPETFLSVRRCVNPLCANCRCYFISTTNWRYFSCRSVRWFGWLVPVVISYGLVTGNNKEAKLIGHPEISQNPTHNNRDGDSFLWGITCCYGGRVGSNYVCWE